MARHRAHLEVMRALRHQQVDESFALQLQRECAVELERGGEQHHGGNGLAHQLLDGRRIFLVLAQLEPRAGEPRGVAADGVPLEYEATDPV